MTRVEIWMVVVRSNAKENHGIECVIVCDDAFRADETAKRRAGVAKRDGVVSEVLTVLWTTSDGLRIVAATWPGLPDSYGLAHHRCFPSYLEGACLERVDQLLSDWYSRVELPAGANQSPDAMASPLS